VLAHFRAFQAVRSGFVSNPILYERNLVDGTPYWHASCPDEVHETHSSYRLYGGGSTGSAKSRSVAVLKAVNEAIERKAFHRIVKDPTTRESFGFVIDKTTTGMACDTSRSSRSARNRALLEAQERWSVQFWWEGFLGHTILVDLPKCVSGIEILSPFGCRVVVLWHSCNCLQVYGFAAGKCTSSSVQRALVELSRNRFVVDYWDKLGRPHASDVYEQRILHFAVAGGSEEFGDRVKLNVGSILGEPRLIIDSKIDGPWSRYGTVWRCLYEGTKWGWSSEQEKSIPFAF
jgi:hypothetical protein